MQKILIWAAPGIFVLLWSTGFIGARLGLPHSEPFNFLFIRFSLVVLILLTVALFKVKKWPSRTLLLHSLVVGVLLHAIYLGGVFFAIDRGMSAGTSALIVSLQPIVTLVFGAAYLGERIHLRTALLFALGFSGVAIVLWPKLGAEIGSLPTVSIVANVVALLAISIGTVYQKKKVTGIDLLPSLVAQYVGATVVLGIMAFATETREIAWTGEFVFALSWLIFVLSLGAVALLMFLISRDSVARTSALFFLVPGFTLIVSNIMFGEQMSGVQIFGLLMASAAVGMVNLSKS